MTTSREGGCVCGAVRYIATGEPERVTICHCTWCQRRTGSGFGVEVVFREGAVSFTGERTIYRHHSDESGRWLNQEFCARCGTNLGITLEAVPGIRTLAAGTFDDPSWLTPEKQDFRYVYRRSARDWSTVPEGAECYEAHFRK